MLHELGPITPSDLVLYRSPKGVVVGVLVRDETVWLTQKALSGCSPWACPPSPSTSEHL